MRVTGRSPLRVGLTLGLVGLAAFGGPAAHVALMRRQVVERQRWLDAATFGRLFAACNLVPGPTSTELALLIGLRLAGWPGLAAAAAAFIAPAALIMLGLAWVYERYAPTEEAHLVLHGIRPVVVAIVAWAALDLGRKLLERRWLLPLVPLAGGLYLVGVNPLLLLAAAAAVGALAARIPRVLAAGPLLGPHPERLVALALTFLKIGAVSFGSGYVLFAFLQSDFVGGLRWLRPAQLVDALALGQVTPGPVFTTATFLGYLFAGVPGALLATVAIFLPGLALVPLLDRIVQAVETRPWLRLLLDAVNAAVIGLVAAVGYQLARASVGDPLTLLIAAAAFPLILWRPLLAPALVLAGAVLGVATGLR